MIVQIPHNRNVKQYETAEKATLSHSNYISEMFVKSTVGYGIHGSPRWTQLDRHC